MAAFKNALAVIFDFDDTLTQDSTSALLAHLDVDPTTFWEKEVDSMVREEGWEPSNAWMHLLLKYMEERRPPGLTNKDLREFGSRLVPFPGLEEFLADLKEIASKAWCEVEFYIISGGIEDIVDGFVLRSKFNAVWGSRLAPETPGGPVKYVKRAITFTEKTRYLFIVNKGINPTDAEKNPTLVNQDVPPEKRPIPFENMFYIGDGLSDIPCFSLIEKLAPDRRNTFGVFRPGDEKSARRAWYELIFPQRATGGTYSANYGGDHSLGAVLRMAFTARCLDIRALRG